MLETIFFQAPDLFGVVSPSSCRLCRRSRIRFAFPALSISSGRIPLFSSSCFCLSEGVPSPSQKPGHNRTGLPPVCSSQTVMDPPVLLSGTHLLELFCQGFFLSAITSSDAFLSAASRSIGHPAVPSRFSVIFRATSFFSQIRSAGWQSSWRSVCQRKSKSNRWLFPSHSLVPRPTIWL